MAIAHDIPAVSEATPADYVALLKPRVMRLVVFIYNIVEAHRAKRPAGDNPWGEGATTLEWQLSSPPPFHQWEELPRVR